MSEKIQIGNITSGYRPIENGNAYEKYFPKPEERDRVIIEDGEVGQTVELMKKVVWKYIDDTKQIAPILKGETKAQSCDNIWNFLYNHIQYRLDKAGLEQLRRPARSWQERAQGIDCDCFSIFASSILTNLGIEHSFRITKYDSNVYQHVYVIVPIGNSYHIIDPVLSNANYEKKYSQKKDFKMSLKGINVAVLSGDSSNDLYDAVMASSLEGVGLGSMSEEQEMQAVYTYLISTRNAIAQNPTIISLVEEPQSFLQMLDYAIKYWNTPKREEALSILAKNESKFNMQNSTSGIEDEWDEDEELLGRIFRRRKKKRPKAFFSNIKKSLKKTGTKLKSLKKVLVRYNPLTITARSGFLLAMKLNIKKMASKLKWAYGSKEQAARKGISASQWQKSRNALQQVERIFADKLQGTRSSLRKAILNGKAGNLNGVLDSNLEGELNGLGIVTAAASGTFIAAATPVIIAVMKVLKSTGLMNKKEKESISKSEISSSQSASSYEQDTQSQEGSDTYKEYKSASYQPDDMPPASRPGKSKILGFLKNNPKLVFGGIVAIGGASYFAIKGIKAKGGIKGLFKAKPSSKKAIKSPKSKAEKKVQAVELK